MFPISSLFTNKQPGFIIARMSGISYSILGVLRVDVGKFWPAMNICHMQSLYKKYISKTKSEQPRDIFDDESG